jgi:hypothetical protein
LFLQNLERRKDETLRPRSGDPMKVFVDLLKGVGVDCGPGHPCAFNKQTGAIVMWNSSPALEAAERLILDLNQAGDEHAISLPLVSRQTVLTQARFLKMTDAQFGQLQLDPSRGNLERIGNSWSLPPEKFQEVQHQLALLTEIEVIGSPRVESSPGVQSRLYTGTETNSIEFESVPYVRGELINLSLAARTTGAFTANSSGDWPNTNGWTNVAVMDRVSMLKGGGVVLRARHNTASAKNNLVVVLTASIKPSDASQSR